MNRLRFSVITPVLNGASDVFGYVESLKLQTYLNWESIIVDDGSTDATLDLLGEAISGDQRFRLASNSLPRKVSGPYQARNLGLSLAQGDFICFLDIDDRWLPNKLESHASQLLNNDHLRLIYSAYYRAGRGSSYGKLRRILPFYGAKFWVAFINPIPMLTACVSRETIAGLKFEPLHHEDYVFWHAVLSRIDSGCVAKSSIPLAIYCVHGDSLSGNKLEAVGWIWKCYRRFGYGFPLSIMAIVLRGLLQVWIKALEAFEQPSPLVVECRQR